METKQGDNSNKTNTSVNKALNLGFFWNKVNISVQQIYISTKSCRLDYHNNKDI